MINNAIHKEREDKLKKRERPEIVGGNQREGDSRGNRKLKSNQNIVEYCDSNKEESISIISLTSSDKSTTHLQTS